MAKRAAALAPDSEVVEALLATIAAAREPVLSGKLKSGLKGPLRRPEERVVELLEAERAAGRVFRFAPQRGKSPCYWHLDHATYARQVIEAAIRRKPLALKDVEKAVAGKLKDLTPAERQAILDDLVGRRRLYLVPGLTARSAVLYSAAPPDPRDYLRSAVKQWRGKLEAIVRQLEPCGVPAGAVIAAALEMLGGEAPRTRPAGPPGAAPPDPAAAAAPNEAPADDAGFAARFDQAFQQLDRLKGSRNFVSLVDLRRTLSGVGREQFDRELRELRRAGRYELSAAESLGGLRPEERQAGIEESGALLLYVSRKTP